MVHITSEAHPANPGKGVKKVSALVQENLELFSLLKRVEPHLEKLYNEVGIKSPHKTLCSSIPGRPGFSKAGAQPRFRF